MPAICQTRITACFDKLKAEGAKGLVVYLTAGDPSLEDTGRLLAAIERGGADLIELGVPFSDPLADGPVIQRASERALKGQATLAKILEHLPKWREQVATPIVLFGYFNPILQYGLERFAKDASQAGVDGVLAVDLTPEEAGPYVEAMRAHHLDTIFLASPTSTIERLTKIGKISTGFLYLVSREGVTGERSSISAALKPLVERVKRTTALPVAVGFGISTPAQVREVQSLADAAVVGSAVVRAIEDRYPSQGVKFIEQYIRWLKHGTGEKPE
ncbi:MAG TPA: tryptophan synthase subunit alpha [Terriglobia bacterium]|nr:tryptophan synthase subunit alpha [Terriglobia bacterium]